MNKSVCLGFSILEWSKMLKCKFWCDYVKPKYGKKVKLCYMDTDSFILYIIPDDIYEDISKNVGTRFEDLILRIKKRIDHYQKLKIQK